MKKICLLTVVLCFSFIVSAEENWYCETGDPSGRGPTATLDISDSGLHHMKVSYNRKDLETGKRSSSFNVKSKAPVVEKVIELGMKCDRMTFVSSRLNRQVMAFRCEGEGHFIRLVNFTKIQPIYNLNCIL